MRLLAPCLILVTASAAFAQTKFVSPAGYATKEGESIFNHWGSTPRRYVGMDLTNRRRPGPIRSMSFRRDRNGGGGNSTAQTLQILCTVAESSMAVVFVDMGKNLQFNKSVVVNQKTFNMPSWVQAPRNPPAPFDFKIKYDKPWVYTGRGAIVWDIEYKNASGRFRLMDRATGSTVTGTSGRPYGAGCSGFTHAAKAENGGAPQTNVGMRFKLTGNGAGASAVTLAVIGSGKVNLNIGACGPLLVLPDILVVPIETADPSGKIWGSTIVFPYIAGAVGAKLYTQLIAVDTAQSPLPFRFSNGVVSTIPPLRGTPGPEAVQMWNNLSARQHAIGGFTFFGMVAVVEFSRI